MGIQFTPSKEPCPIPHFCHRAAFAAGHGLEGNYEPAASLHGVFAKPADLMTASANAVRVTISALRGKFAGSWPIRSWVLRLHLDPGTLAASATIDGKVVPWANLTGVATPDAGPILAGPGSKPQGASRIVDIHVRARRVDRPKTSKVRIGRA